MTDAERMDMQAQIDETVSQILAGIDAQAPDYDKAKYVFDYLASNVAYSTGAPDNQNIISVFVNGETVCQGYAAATQYLLEKLDIPCAVVAGTADGQSHAWNLVKLDGEYYYIDTTWEMPPTAVTEWGWIPLSIIIILQLRPGNYRKRTSRMTILSFRCVRR